MVTAIERSQRILIVEDIEGTIIGLKTTLTAADYEVIIAKDVVEAEDKLSREKWGYLLVDLRLPDKDQVLREDAGDNILRKLKRGEYGNTNQDIRYKIITNQSPMVAEGVIDQYEGFAGIHRKLDDIRPLVEDIENHFCGDYDPQPLSPVIQRWRTIAEISEAKQGLAGLEVKISIPGWDPTQEVTLEASKLPQDIRREVDRGNVPLVLLVKVNLAADSEKDLELGDFEIAPPPVEEDTLG
jgi:CheY-like chemotaxis protein